MAPRFFRCQCKLNDPLRIVNGRTIAKPLTEPGLVLGSRQGIDDPSTLCVPLAPSHCRQPKPRRSGRANSASSANSARPANSASFADYFEQTCILAPWHPSLQIAPVRNLPGSICQPSARSIPSVPLPTLYSLFLATASLRPTPYALFPSPSSLAHPPPPPPKTQNSIRKRFAIRFNRIKGLY